MARAKPRIIHVLVSPAIEEMLNRLSKAKGYGKSEAVREAIRRFHDKEMPVYAQIAAEKQQKKAEKKRLTDMSDTEYAEDILGGRVEDIKGTMYCIYPIGEAGEMQVPLADVKTVRPPKR